MPSRPSQEGLELLADDFVQMGLLGHVAFVLDGGKESIGIMRRSALPAKASDVPRQLRRDGSDETNQSPALVTFSSHSSNGACAEHLGSRSQRDRANSSLPTVYGPGCLTKRENPDRPHI